MRMTVVAVGHKMPPWVREASEDYLKRLPPDFPLELIEVKSAIRTETSVTERLLEEERKRIEDKLPKGSQLIVLDERGALLSTRALSSLLEAFHETSSPLAFVIGGADGLAPPLKSRAHKVLSLSKMTLPHGLARVVLIEQLYRAVSLLKNHPYHRD